MELSSSLPFPPCSPSTLPKAERNSIVALVHEQECSTDGYQATRTQTSRVPHVVEPIDCGIWAPAPVGAKLPMLSTRYDPHFVFGPLGQRAILSPCNAR